MIAASPLIAAMMGATTSTMQWRNSFVAIVTFAGATACSPAPAEKPKRADKPALEAKAVAACECEIARGTGQSPDCWRSYKAAIEPFRPKGEEDLTGYASACAPVSTEVDCLKDADGEFCIATGYSVNGADLAEPRLCRQAEAKAVENAINALHHKVGTGGEWDRDKARRVAEEAIAAARAGKASRPSASSDGCI
ncbi:hypothetical protein [Sphingopyxis kveilinensis]|uniref:hypothetical protein n=1 Tax=Sphingopyxis kveilinensis TaxID=3114367 RepID=UPI0030D33A9C